MFFFEINLLFLSSELDVNFDVEEDDDFLLSSL